MVQTQAVPTGQRWMNALPLVAGMSWLGPVVNDVATTVVGAIAPTAAAVPPAQLGQLIVGVVMMTAASAVREKIERDLRLEPDDPTKPMTWRQVFRRIALQLGARIG